MIDQQHSGSGDNVAGNKSTKNYIAINSIWIAAVVILIGLGVWLIPGLMPQPVPLAGYVLSNAKVPEPGVNVTVNTPDRQTYETFTDENGFFLFDEVNLQKIDSVEIVASLKERSIIQYFGQLGPQRARVNIQLPPGTPPFEVAYYDISGVSLNYLYDGKVDDFWEKRLGGQPYIIPNDIFEAFKDLGERFSYDDVWEGLPILDPASNMSGVNSTGEEFSKNLRGIASNEPYNGNSQSYDYVGLSPQLTQGIIQNIDGWRRYSPESNRFEPVSKEELAALQSKVETVMSRNDYSSTFEVMEGMSQIWAPLTKEELAYIYGVSPGRQNGIIDYLSRDNLPEGFVFGFFAASCGGGQDFLITQPTYQVKVAVLENNTSDPIALDSFYISSSNSPSLRSEKENAPDQELVKRLFPKNTLKPGDKLLIPVAIQLRASQETEEYEYIHEDFFYGPSWSIKQVRIENQIFPFREKDSELVALYYGGQVGSCPYAYTYSEESQRWMLEDHILFGRSARERIGYDEILLKRFNGELLIKEEDPETSYIDLIEIRLEKDDGNSSVLQADHTGLRRRDGMNFQMEQGDKIKLIFEDFDAGAKGKYYLRSYGYYEPYTGTTDNKAISQFPKKTKIQSLNGN